MEFLRPPTIPHTFSKSSIFTPKISISIHITKTLKPPNLKISPFSTFHGNFRVSAHFGRPASRRKNFLRKKLTETHQVSPKPTISSPSFDFENNPVQEFGNFEEKFDLGKTPVQERGKDDIFGSNFDFERNPVQETDTVDIFGSKSDIRENPVQESDKTDVFGTQFDVGKKLAQEIDNVKNSAIDSRVKSVLLEKLESWADQYKADSEYWGVGTGPIFTVFEKFNGEVEKVVVDEDEILRRSQIEPLLYKSKGIDGLGEVKSKMSRAKVLAKEMEAGKNVIPRTSSVAKFVKSGAISSFVSNISRFSPRLDMFPKLDRVGVSVLCGFFVFFVWKSFFSASEDRKDRGEYTSLEKEMLRRKIKARKEKEKLVKGSVEVVETVQEPDIVFTEKPRLDMKYLLSNITKVKAENHKLGSGDPDLDFKIQEIRAMARHARETERTDSMPSDIDDGEDSQSGNDSSTEEEFIEVETASLDDQQVDDSKFSNDSAITGKGEIDNMDVPIVEVPKDAESIPLVVENGKFTSNVSETDVSWLSGTHLNQENETEKSSIRAKPRIIMLVKEAREYLSHKHDNRAKDGVTEVTTVKEIDNDVGKTNMLDTSEKGIQQLGENGKMFHRESVTRSSSTDSLLEEKYTIPSRSNDPKGNEEGYDVVDNEMQGTYPGHGKHDGTEGESPPVTRNNWMENNFHELEPVLMKMGVGFKDNYMVAREKAKDNVDLVPEMLRPQSDGDDHELDWMKDDRLREIVFQVRENELAGRDPFYLMDAEDKLMFFEGLEKKVEEENEKLQDLHQWLHSNIENLDYGADGISMYDPPEKVIPKWKGPPLDASPDFISAFEEQRKTLFNGNVRDSNLLKSDGQGQKFEESRLHASTRNDKLQGRDSKSSKIVIEGSDGSVRPGKKSGKEYWQHTKKWTRGFLELYNAETDPEIKAIMKDMGKDLDRWITEKEIKEAADLMDKLPKKGQKIIKEKLEKVRRETELYGPHAVMSKYSEYAEEKEVDYLWWLDLPYVLCIEIYEIEDGEERIGFYSLEMAAELELEPKPNHVIAFEDASDCKNLCYIIQAEMERLGNGNAFVVAQPPKDAFREAKANGFNVTVIRKGELKLNVDQTLEEVEEQITEIGSKMYHDQVTRGRSVNIGSVMKGVFGIKRPLNRRRLMKKVKKMKKRTK